MALKKYVLAALAAACCLPAAAQDWKFGASVGYETGRYGGGRRVDSVYAPLTLRRCFRNTDLAVTVPYLRQSSTGRVTRVGGKSVRIAAPGASGSGRAAGGPGDVLVSGRYNIKRDAPGSFDFDLGGRLKLPTANEKKGLGTGQLDQGAGFEFGKVLNPRWKLLASGYYTIIGDPSGIDFNNQLELSMGFLRPLGGETALTVLYETNSALIDGNADPRSLSASVSAGAPGGNQFSAGLSLGLSEGSPALGFGAGLSRRF